MTDDVAELTCIGLIAESCAGPVELWPVGLFGRPRPVCAACVDAGGRLGLIDRRRSTTDDRRRRDPAGRAWALTGHESEGIR